MNKRRDITREKICLAAIQIVEKAGLEGLNMRKLAAKLNIEAASLYNHIANKAELFDLIQEHLYSQMPAQLSEKNWQTHLFELAITTRQNLLRIPKMVILFATRPTVTASSLKQIDFTLNILMKAGFKASEALLIYTNLHVFVLGHVLAEVGLVPGEKDISNEPSLAKINIDSYPALKKAYSYKSSTDFEKGFKLGLHCMIDHLKTL